MNGRLLLTFILPWCFAATEAGQALAAGAAAGSAPGSEAQVRLLWMVIGILSFALLVTLLLLLRERRRNRALRGSDPPLAQPDPAESPAEILPASDPHPYVPAAEAEPGEPELPAQPPSQEPPTAARQPAFLAKFDPSGQLTTGQIPALLNHIATSDQVGTLLIRSEYNEKRISFSYGKIVAASSVNLSTKYQSGFLMNKLGYLLVRQGKISEDDRDRALVLCEGDPNLRLGEALIRLGIIRRKQLLQSLQDQAKMVLHSLIVFPEGDFEFINEEVAISQRDSLEIVVTDFLKEAAGNQSEWRNIRQLIPSLDCVLRFAPNGQDKIHNSRMTVHQKFVLSLIDGKRRIRDICNEATMLDYELYRFLYLMVRANILQQAS